MSRAALGDAFAERFGRRVAEWRIKSIREANGWTIARKTGDLRGVYVNGNGYSVKRFVCPTTGKKSDRFFHVLNWEKHHGPIPSGFGLKCISGDKADYRVENWIMLPLPVIYQLQHMQSISDLPEDLREAVIALAYVKAKLKSISKRNRHSEAVDP